MASEKKKGSKHKSKHKLETKNRSKDGLSGKKFKKLAEKSAEESQREHAPVHAHVSFDSVVGAASVSGARRIDRRTKWNSQWNPSPRATLFFGIAAAIWTAVILVLAIVLSLTSHPYRSAVAVGLGALVLGVLRGAWPGRPWFASRRRGPDAAVYILVGIAILVFAPWTATGIPG